MDEKGFGLNIHDDFLFYFVDRCNRMSVLITRVCLVVDIHQMGRVDSRIGLGGGQAGVAKQFLDRPQVTASRQQNEWQSYGASRAVWRWQASQAASATVP